MVNSAEVRLGGVLCRSPYLFLLHVKELYIAPEAAYVLVWESGIGGRPTALSRHIDMVRR